MPAMTHTSAKRGVFLATVRDNIAVCREHFRLLLSVDGFPASTPGQFVQLGCGAPNEWADEPDAHDWAGDDDPGIRTNSLVSPVPLLRRPFSLAGAWADPDRDGATVLDIIARRVGLGTGRLESLQAGDQIDLIGPLGHGFPLPEVGQTAVMVGGGVGIPPMVYLSEALGKAGLAGVAISGVQTADLLPLTRVADIEPDRDGRPNGCIEQFARHAIDAVVSTDDGSLGVAGLVTVALQRVLEHLDLPAEKLVVYTCGPEVMMRAVTEMALAAGATTWVCMERNMACGVGTCQSCVCRTQPPGAEDWTYKLVCTDGPVFAGRDLRWD